MIVILLGPPGAGKGTQAKVICESKNLFHFSTGDILRNEVETKSEIGKKIENIINSGKLVGDDIIIEIVEKIISQEEISANKGILFDGFPRNLDQARAFEELLKKKKKKIDCVIHLVIDQSEIIKRIQKRQTEENRKDDNVEILKSRIEVYLKETSPLVDMYKKKSILKALNGMKNVSDVTKDIDIALNLND